MMRALTLWQPMCWAISDIPEPFAKRIENREWPPPPYFIGKYIALHAGAKYHKEHAEQILDVFDIATPPPELLPQKAVVAVMRVVGVVTESIDEWFSGTHGWLLEDVHRLTTPVSCKGAQGLWTLPEDIEAKVREQVLLPDGST